MPYNPKSLLNLKHIKKGKSGNPAGRPPALASKIKAIPKDAQVKVYEVLHHAISLPNVKAAREYLESEATQEALGEYGFMLQIALKALISKSGWLTVCDILDRLFGTPHRSLTADLSLDLDEAPVIVFRSTEDEAKD